MNALKRSFRISITKEQESIKTAHRKHVARVLDQLSEAARLTEGQRVDAILADIVAQIRALPNTHGYGDVVIELSASAHRLMVDLETQRRVSTIYGYPVRVVNDVLMDGKQARVVYAPREVIPPHDIILSPDDA